MTTVPAPQPSARRDGVRPRRSGPGVRARLAGFLRLRRASTIDGRIAALQLENSQLRVAVAARDRIGPAIGMLMLVARCDRQSASDLLVRLSGKTGRRLITVSDELLAALPDGNQALPADLRRALGATLPLTPQDGASRPSAR